MSEPITQQELDELRAVEKAAAGGPWELARPGYDGDNWIRSRDSETMGDFVLDLAPFQNPDSPDLAFILAARTALPRLLDEVERLRDALNTEEEPEDVCARCFSDRRHHPHAKCSGFSGNWGDAYVRANAEVERLRAELEAERAKPKISFIDHKHIPAFPDDAEEHEAFLAVQEGTIAAFRARGESRKKRSSRDP